MISLADALQDRILAAQNGTLEKKVEMDVKEYNKKWAEAVNFFTIRINKDRKREKNHAFPILSFIAVRQKLCHIKEVDTLRWFYGECIKYSRTRDKITNIRNTFSRGFFGALDIKP